MNKELIVSLPVRAPIDGIVVGFEKLLGHVVQPADPIFEIHDASHAWVQGFLSERDLPNIRIGQQARMRFVTSPGDVVHGTVVRSGQSVSTEDRTLSVWIEMAEMPSFPIRHNMLSRVAIQLGDSQSDLAVPLPAIVREGSRTYVFVQSRDLTFERRLVVTGVCDDLRVAITHGLSPGETIAVAGAAALQSGYAALR